MGKSRAECCVKLLKELNPDVEGESIFLQKVTSDTIIEEQRLNTLQEATLESVLNSDSKYTLIMYTFPIDSDGQALIHKYGEEQKVPVMSIHSVGFYSYFRIHLPGNFPIVDTHPDSTATTDLRLLTPWEELSKFAADLTSDLENSTPEDHGHIPYVALLLHYLSQWKQKHGSLPSTYKEKVTFRSLVAAGARTNTAEGGEENFDEAVAAVLKTISAPSLSSAVREVFEYKPTEVRLSIPS